MHVIVFLQSPFIGTPHLYIRITIKDIQQRIRTAQNYSLEVGKNFFIEIVTKIVSAVPCSFRILFQIIHLSTDFNLRRKHIVKFGGDKSNKK